MADTKESLRKKRLAYLGTFCGDGNTPHPLAQEVLKDMRKFAGLDYSSQKPGIVTSSQSGMVDSHATVYRAALRDFYFRIVGFLSIDEKHMYQEIPHESLDGSKTAEQ